MGKSNKHKEGRGRTDLHKPQDTTGQVPEGDLAMRLGARHSEAGPDQGGGLQGAQSMLEGRYRIVYRYILFSG